MKLLQHRDPARQLRATAALGSLLATEPSEAWSARCLPGYKTAAAAVSAERARGCVGPVEPAAQPRVRRPGARTAASFAHQSSRAIAERTALRTNVMAALARLGVTEPRNAEWLDDADAGVRRNAALLLSSVIYALGRHRSAASQQQCRRRRSPRSPECPSGPAREGTTRSDESQALAGHLSDRLRRQHIGRLRPIDLQWAIAFAGRYHRSGRHHHRRAASGRSL